MKIYKLILSFILCFALSFCFFGCSKNEEKEEQVDKTYYSIVASNTQYELHFTPIIQIDGNFNIGGIISNGNNTDSGLTINTFTPKENYTFCIFEIEIQNYDKSLYIFPKDFKLAINEEKYAIYYIEPKEFEKAVSKDNSLFPYKLYPNEKVNFKLVFEIPDNQLWLDKELESNINDIVLSTNVPPREE